MKIGPPEAAVHENVFLGVQCHSDTRLLHRIHVIVRFLSQLTSAYTVQVQA